MVRDPQIPVFAASYSPRPQPGTHTLTHTTTITHTHIHTHLSVCVCVYVCMLVRQTIYRNLPAFLSQERNNTLHVLCLERCAFYGLCIVHYVIGANTERRWREIIINIRTLFSLSSGIFFSFFFLTTASYVKAPIPANQKESEMFPSHR